MPSSNDGDLFADGHAFAHKGARRPKGDRIQQLEDALEKAQKRARMWEMSYQGLSRQNLRLVAMLCDLQVPVEKLAEWQVQLDHIEAIKMNGMSRVKSVALWAASDDGDVQD
jgi:hypothetical protein